MFICVFQGYGTSCSDLEIRVYGMVLEHMNGCHICEDKVVAGYI